MDIESEYRKRKILKAAGEYDLQWCRWRVMGVQNKKKKEIYNPNPKGYIHGACLLKNAIYAFFGPDENRPTASMHSYSFKASEWKEWNECNLPQARDSFGLTVHQNQIFMYGGSSYDSQFGDLHAFNTLTCSWRRIQTSTSPIPRNPLIFTDIRGEAILLFGGINVQTGQIFNDAFLFKDGDWSQITLIVDAPLNLIGDKFAICNNAPYLFGGEFEDGNGNFVPSTNVFKLEINVDELSLRFVEMKSQSRAPCSRTAHSMVGIGNDYLVIVGGQSLGENQMLRDIWLFDVLTTEWVKIDPANGPIRPLADNSLLLNGSALLVLGGLTEVENMWNQQILTLEFGESQPYRNQICSNCLQRSSLRQKVENSFPRTVVITSGFFYTISLQIKHPFQAIQMLYDCAEYLKASRFSIAVEQSLNNNEHIEIEWDGKTLTKQQFQDFICHSSTYDETFSRFVIFLKVGSLRLGKTLIYITADENERKVFMFSADSKVTPAFDQTYGFFAYSENIKKNCIESHQGRAHKRLILNVLRSRLSAPEQALTVTNCNRLLIFEKNILVTSDRVYYYELIPRPNDITLYKSAKKVQFLDELGYEISKEPELSLRSYLSLLRIDMPAPYIGIGPKRSQVIPCEYAQRLRNLQGQGRIIQFEMPSKIHDIEIDSVLYIAKNEDVIHGNLGLLVYYQGKLVNRFSGNFGELFKEEFYKTKFKKATTVFEYLGIINIRRGLALNYFSNWFKKNRNYYSFLDYLKIAMRKAKTEKNERKLKVDPQYEDPKHKLKQ